LENAKVDLLLPNLSRNYLKWYNTNQIEFPNVIDAFLVHSKALNRVKRQEDYAEPWLNNYAHGLLRDCQIENLRNSSSAIQCQENSMTFANAKKRVEDATSEKDLSFAVGYNYADLFANDLFRNTTGRARSSVTNGKEWWEISINTPKIYSRGSSLNHWDPVWMGQQEKIFFQSSRLLSSKNPPLYSDTDFLKQTYQNSGYGNATIAALRTLGYRINGIPPLPPMKGTVIPFDAKQESE
jgi:hypothetical protein